MAVYVYRGGRMVDKATGEPMVTGPFRPVTPMHIPDIPAYQSPVTGEYISGRQAKRADLDRHNCVDAAELPGLGGKLKNKRFAEKRGLQHMLSDEVK